MKKDHILTHHAENRKEYFNAVAPPIIQSSNFAFDSIKDFQEKISDELNNYIYTRGNNPTVNILRKKIAELEHAEDALITSSGSAAIAMALTSQVKSGDHVVCVEKPYAWTKKLLLQILERFGVSATFVDGREISNIQNAILPETKVLFLESPNSITFELQDLEECVALAKKHNLITIIDNSHCSPIFQNPIDYGIDIVVHSGTKYLNGHSDVLIGAICSSKEVIKQIYEVEYMTFGVNISPHDAALVIRGLRTLDLRLKKSDENVKAIVAALKDHPRVAKIVHTLSPDFPQYDLAKKQMRGNGGLFGLELNVETKEDVQKFVEHLNNFIIAVSWGGYESLMLPTLCFHDLPHMPDSPITWKYIRFYAGIEDADFLIEDLKSALDAI